MDVNFLRRERINPKDDYNYEISELVFSYTEKVLLEYAKLDHEGFLYWGGKKEGTTIRITHVIAPATNHAELRITTSKYANANVIDVLISNNIIHLGQIHSHPGNFTDHSPGDDEYATFKVEGLISIVVPYYGERGMLPLEKCGVHRYESGGFKRLSDKYIKKRFRVIKSLSGEFEDLRNEL